MVFESIVADLLNRFLGDFVENLDSSQLNLGIWGGDVKLNNLEVKETALDDLDLPVKLKFGYLSSLVLQIPWKNLYNEPVVATIDGLHLIVVPNKGVVYSEEKARKNADDIKQKTLARLEEARKNRRKPADEAADSFAEKMVAQIIKNLQVTISNIHVRFEDKYTNRHRPFVAGLTLHKLDFQTTDENWLPTIHKDVVKVIHKLVSLESLAVYWNSKAELFSDLSDRAVIKKKLQESIATNKNRPIGFKYILDPIKMEAKLKLNQKPETDGSGWTIPKIDLSVDMQTLALTIGQLQYQDILLFLEAQERFNLATQYLKYRPNLNEYKQHYKQWWKFAYECVLEEKVRRRRNNWSWERMKNHRKLVRDYRDAWVRHQTEKSPGASVTDVVKLAESTLDVFNVNVARQQAEMEIDRKGLTRLEDQPQGWVAWTKSWWGGSGQPAQQNDAKPGDLMNKFEAAMTPEEKAKLFEAIDYQENIPPTNYPKQFVENRLEFKLGQVAIVVDGAVSLQLLKIRANIEQRPSASAMNLRSSIAELRMDGCGAEMLRVRDPSVPWLSLLVDTNPLNAKYDQLVKLAVAPITLKYHAPAINNAIEVFKPPESVKLNQLTAAAMSRYEEVKTRSVTGLAHAVEKKTKLVLDMNIQPATILVSEGGVYSPSKPTILADMGLLTISTVDAPVEIDSKKDKLQQLMEQAYDRFRVKLTNVVIILAEDVEKANVARTAEMSELHLLRPTGFDIEIHKSSIDDLRLPKMRVLGDLPDIVLAISDERLLMLLKLLASIPKPAPEEEVLVIEDAPVESKAKLRDRAKMRTIMEAEEVDESALARAEEKKKEEDKSKTSEQQVQIELDLALKQIGVVVLRGSSVLCDVQILRMRAQLQMRTFDMVVKAELGSIRVGLPMFKSLDVGRETLYLVDSHNEHSGTEGADPLMKLKFVQANPESPFFATEYQSTEQSIDFQFSTLNMSLHQEGLMELKQFGEQLQSKMAELDSGEGKVEEVIEDGGRKISRRISESMQSIAAMASASQTEAAAEKKKRRKKAKEAEEPDPNVIKMRLDARIVSLAVLIGTQKQLETRLAIENVHADVKMRLKDMHVAATLQNMIMEDRVQGAMYKKLMSVAGEQEMLRFEMTQYNRDDKEKAAMLPTDIDMSVKVRLARMRFVFLNLWLCRLMAWLAPFQAEAARAAAVAKDAAAERAAEAAAAARKMIEQSPPRIELDVELDAPIIVLPRLSTSRDVLVLCLGKLQVRNKICGNKEFPKAVLDKMDVSLTEMNFGIGEMDKDVQQVDSLCEILKPLTFTIAVNRNLAWGVCREIPEMAVDARIPGIEADMSQDDYKTLMQTLSGNLAEGKELMPVNEVDQVAGAVAAATNECAADRKKSRMVRPGDREGDADKNGEERQGAGGEEEEPVLSAKPKLVFKFNLDKISAVLYSGGETSGKRDPKDAFAALRLVGLTLSGQIREDTAMAVAMSLSSFTMDDERKEKTKIHRLMDKKDGHDRERFLALSFTQDAKQNKNVKVKMSAFYILLCPEFLGCIASFFAVPPSDEEAERVAVTAAAAPSGAAPATPAPAPAPAQPAGAMTMDCDMEGVEVILVENSQQPENSQALILSFNVKLAAEPKEKEQTMRGGIEKLTIFSSYYAPERRKEVTYEVLKSLDIGVFVRIQNESKATEAQLKMTPLELRMSPSIIRLLSSVNAEFAASSATESQKSVSAPKMKTFPDYWSVKKLDFNKFWFMKKALEEEECETAEEAEEGSHHVSIQAPIELATVEMPSISFTLEAGQGAVPIPLIFVDMRMNAKASNWSSALHASADMSLQTSYYNEACSVWEPVIEPVETEEGRFERWNVNCTVVGRNKLDPTDTNPGMDVKIEADRMLNVTVTKSFLGLLTKLGELFEQAAKNISPPTCRQLPGLAPFLVLNETGMIVRVTDSDTLKVQGDGSSEGAIDATHGAFVDAHLKNTGYEGLTAEEVARKMAEQRLSLTQEERRAELRLELQDTVREVRVGRAEKQAVALPKKTADGRQWQMVVETSIENSRRLVTLRSHVQVENHLSQPMEVFSKRDTSLDLAAEVPPGHRANIPVPLLYTENGELFFKPQGDSHDVSFECVSWHGFCAGKRQAIRCDDAADPKHALFLETVVKEERLKLGEEDTATYVIHLYPPLLFQNCLPMPVTLELPIATELAPGEETILNVIPGCKVKLTVDHMGEKYILDMPLEEKREDLAVVAANTDTGSAELLLGMHWSTEHGGLKGQIYAPFWLVNNTGLTLKHMEGAGGLLASATSCSCRGSKPDANDETHVQIKHLPDQNPIVLPFPSTDFMKKKKARVQVEGVWGGCGSGWSDEFPLDTVGNAGRVTCKGPERDYELTVDIALCQSGLTKVVTFSPFYLVSNCGRFDLQVREDQSNEWTTVPAEKCIGIWPAQRAKRKLLCARFAEESTGEERKESLLFPITENIETLCQMDGPAVGVDVSVSVGESSVAIHLAPFQPGMAPALIINHLKIPVLFGQKGSSKIQKLNECECAFFAWDDVVGKRILAIEAGEFKGEDALDQNRFIEFKPKESVRRFCYLVNFLVGRQRTILLTPDLTVAQSAFGSWETDKVDMHCEMSLQGIGLSVVDNIAGKEVLFIGISSSDILWEEETKKGRFKPFAVKQMEALEEAYQKHITEKKDGGYEMIGSNEVNLATMIMKKKKNKEVKIRRIFEKGIWLSYGTSPQRTRLHAKLNHLQIDNQLDACVFPCVLGVVPPPKSVVADNAPKPFVEVSLLQRQTEYSNVAEVEYARVLVQEFAVRVDQGLINALLALVATEGGAKPYDKAAFEKDVELTKHDLSQMASQYKSQRPKSFYNDLHISPLMIHLSFSQGGTSGEAGAEMPIQSEFFNVLLKSVGVTLTELQDVVFKLAYFERKCVFYSPDQLNGEIISHYTKQAIKQLYVLVLGLDIIGNPFGLVRDLSAGVEDLFYQPFQGAIQGPEEFAQGMALGVQSLFGHAVGGAAGAVGRITGTVGKGVAALTFDDEYQRKRQEDMNRRPQSFGEGVARGVKGLGMGVVSGITGVVTKPVEGAKQEGASGFIKGVGKGLIGVVARPVSGVVDFASSSMDAVKTVAGAHKETGPVRPPRVLRADRIVRPYSANEAIGYKIYKDTDRGELAASDQFVCHASIAPKMVVVVTDARIALVKRTDVMGVWAVDWQCLWTEMRQPEFVPTGIKIVLKEKKRGFLGIGGSEGKIITFQQAAGIQNKIMDAYQAAVQG